LQPLQLKEKVRKLIGWIGCSPIPLTIQELEQAVTVISQGAKGNGLVFTRLDIARICGPIVEVIDDYVQFVHFTVQEYVVEL
jgi:hypothetical protein